MFPAASLVFSSASMLHAVSPSAGSRLRTGAHIVSLLSRDLTGCGSGTRWGFTLADGALGGGATLELCLTLCSDWDLKADPGDQLSTIPRHHLGESLFFKANQPFQSSELLLVWSPVAPPWRRSSLSPWAQMMSTCCALSSCLIRTASHSNLLL